MNDDEVEADKTPATLEFFQTITHRTTQCSKCIGGRALVAADAYTPAQWTAAFDFDDDAADGVPPFVAGTCRPCRGMGSTTEVVQPVDEVILRVPCTVIEVERADDGRLACLLLRDERPYNDDAQRRYWLKRPPIRTGSSIGSGPIPTDWTRWQTTGVHLHPPAKLPIRAGTSMALDFRLGAEVRVIFGERSPVE